MKYLFFDCEFASSLKRKEKICEFGYVLVDEKFNVLGAGNFIMNPYIPNNEWDWYALKHVLTRKKEEYLSKPNFPYFYKKILNLLNDADLILGYSVSADVHAVNCEFERYKLTPKDFIFFDIKDLYKEFAKLEKIVSLENALKEQKIYGNPNNHDAEADAYNTMLLAECIENKCDKSLSELLDSCPSSKDQTTNLTIASLLRIEQEKAERKKQKEAK